MVKNNKLQLEALSAQYEKLLPLADKEGTNSIKQELFLIKRVIDDLLWSSLEDDVKQQKRKAMLSIMDKWSYEEGSGLNASYEKSVVELYDCIEEVLNRLTGESIFFERLKAVLLIEKIFINEQKEFNKMRHMDFYVWTDLLSENKQNDKYSTLNLEKLDTLFKQMYLSWPKRPYKEIQ